jgi:hypothetical protein
MRTYGSNFLFAVHSQGLLGVPDLLQDLVNEVQEFLSIIVATSARIRFGRLMNARKDRAGLQVATAGCSDHDG